MPRRGPRRLLVLLFVLGLLLHRLFVGLPDGSLSCLTVVLPLCQDCHVFVLLLVLLFVGRALMIGLDVLSRLRLLGRAVLALVALALFVSVLTKICVVGSQGLVDILGAPLSLVFVCVVCFGNYEPLGLRPRMVCDLLGRRCRWFLVPRQVLLLRC